MTESEAFRSALHMVAVRAHMNGRMSGCGRRLIVPRTSSQSPRYRVAECASLAAAQRGAVLAARLAALFCLATMGFIDPQAIAQEVPAQYRMAMDPTVLTVGQEKVKAEMPGSDFKECASGCPVMIVIPAGKFSMGSPESEPDRETSEGPQHEVTIADRFAASKFEVTFQEWDACVAAAGCPAVADRWGRGKMPAINVSWKDAKQYVAWLARLTGKDYRLLTEAEWEYAARAGTKTLYWWGDDPRVSHANCDGCGSQWDLRQTAPVGSLKPNAFGLYDMHGNVWEWVEDSWHENYVGAPTNGSAWLRNGDPGYRVVRGGSWRNESEFVRAAVRVQRNINVRFDTLGLRVARTIRP
jgi:formylglycine-generating enzyme required for sulfatase activity